MAVSYSEWSTYDAQKKQGTMQMANSSDKALYKSYMQDSYDSMINKKLGLEQGTVTNASVTGRLDSGASADAITSKLYGTMTVDRSAYGEDDLIIEGNLRNYQGEVAQAQEDSEAAASFRQQTYETYRNKYLQHSGTTLGTSSGASKVVIG